MHYLDPTECGWKKVENTLKPLWYDCPQLPLSLSHKPPTKKTSKAVVSPTPAKRVCYQTEEGADEGDMSSSSGSDTDSNTDSENEDIYYSSNISDSDFDD